MAEGVEDAGGIGGIGGTLEIEINGETNSTTPSGRGIQWNRFQETEYLFSCGHFTQA